MAKTAIQKTQTDALAKMEDWEIELAEKAKAEVATEVLGIPRISHRGGILKTPDGKKVEGNKIPLAIITYGLVKTYYAEAYDPNAEGQTPDCYAFATAEPGAEAKMMPHAQARSPQSPEGCATCPHNRFGTAEKGNGKRCSDKRRVLAVVEVKDKKSIQAAQVCQFEIPPGSLRNWGNYLKSLKEIVASGNVRQVLTEFSAEPSETGAHVLTFKPIGKLAKEQALALIEKGKQMEQELFTPFPNIQRDEPKPQRSEKARAKLRGGK